MKDSVLLKLSIIISLLGITIMFIYSEELDAPSIGNSQINDLNSSESVVKLKGNVISIKEMEEITILKIARTEYTDIVIFDNFDSAAIKKGDDITVEGHLEEYKGDIEIVASKVYGD